MLQFAHVNLGAVAVATLINIVIGSFWYSPLVFGKAWSKLTGLNMMEMPKKAANLAIGIVALSALLQSLALAVVITSLGAYTVSQGLTIGLVIWVGFTAATTVGDTLYSRRGWKLWGLNSGFFLVVQLLNAVILSIWK